MCPVAPLDLRAADQAEVGLIEQRRRLQAVSGPLGGHEYPRELVQLAVHERNELLERGGIAIRPRFEEHRHIWRSHGSGGNLTPWHSLRHSTISYFGNVTHALTVPHSPVVVRVGHLNRHVQRPTWTADGRRTVPQRLLLSFQSSRACRLARPE